MLLRACRDALVLVFLCGAVVAAQDRTVELLQRITDAAGAPGFEEPIRRVMLDAMLQKLDAAAVKHLCDFTPEP